MPQVLHQAEFLELLSVPVKIATLTTFNNQSVIVWSESQIEHPCTEEIHMTSIPIGLELH